jgi:hypothetical protein
MLLIKNIYINRPTKKMDYRFLGLFAITEKIKMGIFKLYLIFTYQRLYSVFHISFLKSYRRKAGVEPPFLLLIKIDGEKEWEIEKILSARIRYEKVEFKIR